MFIHIYKHINFKNLLKSNKGQADENVSLALGWTSGCVTHQLSLSCLNRQLRLSSPRPLPFQMEEADRGLLARSE
mgnify:CR=1